MTMTTTPEHSFAPVRDGLGALTTKLLGIAAEIGDFLDDPITVAYGIGDEMLPIVCEHVTERMNAALAEAGLTADEYDALIETRTTPRWAYMNVSHVVAIARGEA